MQTMGKRVKRAARWIAGVTVLALMLAGCGGTTPPANEGGSGGTTTPPAGQGEAPKVTGEITLYTSESQDQVNEMKADFEAANPGVKVNVFRSGTGEVIAKLQTEMESNQVAADLIWFADYAYFDSIADKHLLAHDSPSAKGLKPEFKYADGKFYEVRTIYNVVAYNTKAITTPPTSWQDLLDPSVKGKVGMASPLYSGAAFATLGTLVNMDDFGWDFFQGLKNNEAKVETGNGGVNNKLATGEYTMVSVVDFMVRNAKADGSPVDYVWPAEGAILIPTPVGIMKDSKNPEAAKAFVDYLLSERGQKLFLKQGYIPVQDGLGVPEGTPDMAQLKLAPTDNEYIEQNREMLKTEYGKLFPQ